MQQWIMTALLRTMQPVLNTAIDAAKGALVSGIDREINSLSAVPEAARAELKVLVSTVIGNWTVKLA